ncbi:DUF6382 domain-containing protein [Anaerolentibacter hominis]|uniref:DUF6382 domain-containing protein n=1 Tax=Anaerolentibacter hominis TaxID=3079009 RepID=UPI0031B839E1
MSELITERKKDIHKEYLIIKGTEETYRSKMLCYNEISGVVALEIHRIDNNLEYHYDITGYTDLKQFLKQGNIDADHIKDWLRGILQTIDRGENFLLAEQDFILDPEYVFINKKNKIELCYLDGYCRPVQEQLTALFEELINCVDYKDEAAVTLAYELYDACRKNCSYDGLMDILRRSGTPLLLPEPEEYQESEMEELSSDKVQSLTRKELNGQARIRIAILLLCMAAAGGGLWFGGVFQGADGSVDWIKTVVFLAVCIVTAAVMFWPYLKSEPEMDEADKPIFSEISALGYSALETERTEEDTDKTIILREFSKPTGYCLQSVDTERKIMLESPCTIIGKKKMTGQGYLDDCTISRQHAKLEEEGGKLYITDLNSTNGTYVNGIRLTQQEKQLLQPGDQVLFARLEFRLVREE